MAVYGPWLEKVFDDYLAGKTVKVLIVTSAHTVNVDHTFRSSITSEATGTGYTAGGVAATGVAATYDSAANQLQITCDPVDFGTVELTDVGGFIFYVDHGSAGTDRLLTADMLASPIEVDPGSTLQYQPHADGLFVATIGA